MPRSATALRFMLPGLLVLALQAETAPPPAAAGATVMPAPVDAAALTGLVQTTTLRGSVGWRDNVLLSTFSPISRTFGRAEIEALLLQGQGDWQLVSFLTGDVLRYISPPPETAGEQLWFLHGEARWRHWPAWRVALKADGFLQDAVVDLSETENVRTVAPTRAQGGFVTATTELMLPGGFVFEPQVQAKWISYRDFPGAFRETRVGARLTWTRSEAFTVAATWLDHDRAYSDRQEYTAGGRPLPGTRLDFRQQEAELKVSTTWEGSGKWTVALAAGRLENRDRASGFFDYDQNRARLDLTWRRASWTWVVGGEDRRMDYRIQTVGTGTAPPPREAEIMETSVRLERELTEAWTVFAEHRWERNRSNETEFNYRANTVLAGLQRSF